MTIVDFLFYTFFVDNIDIKLLEYMKCQYGQNDKKFETKKMNILLASNDSYAHKLRKYSTYKHTVVCVSWRGLNEQTYSFVSIPLKTKI